MMKINVDVLKNLWQALSNETQSFGETYRLSFTCPKPGRVIEHTQNQDLLPISGRNDSLSRECLKENRMKNCVQRKGLSYLLGVSLKIRHSHTIFCIPTA